MRKAIALTTFALLLCTLGSAQATTVLKVNTAQMAHTSQWVVRANVLSVKTVDLRHEGRALFTDIELAFTEIYGGKAVPSRYTLRLIGGTGADGVVLKIPGMPVFHAGEDVVLFLEKTPVGHIPCGLGQGVFRVLNTPSGDLWVRQATGHVNLLKRAKNGRLTTAHPTFDETNMPLDTLVSKIHHALLGGKNTP
jgi:hypothetical protein